MQGGDIGSEYGKRIVVVMEPLLAYTQPVDGPTLRSRFSLSKEKRAKHDADRYSYNDRMMSWILWYCRTYSQHCSVWSFLDEPLFDLVQLPIARHIGNYVTEWERFDGPAQAYRRLRDDPDILTVYDADPERVAHYWHFRGCAVLIGETP